MALGLVGVSFDAKDISCFLPPGALVNKLSIENKAVYLCILLYI